ncbi:hypothetical protein HanXRQr2_Chr09g0377461 [Helianthus annuus]|uniref:Uncharacterized protein n=1 Tax=Helianthus annuus TaxID=4232 RepID=A0A9K3I3W1_HELAN|nr:hypothetical protein HanXRQr2_Chr09g0377461 [Helianthus annuus]
MVQTIESTPDVTGKFRGEISFKLGMMWHPGKICINFDLSLHCTMLTRQISGRNFFQVGDDVTTRTFEVSIVIVNLVLLCRTAFYHTLR